VRLRRPASARRSAQYLYRAVDKYGESRVRGVRAYMQVSLGETVSIAFLCELALSTSDGREAIRWEITIF